jgi:DivIVA domain-containing protein
MTFEPQPDSSGLPTAEFDVVMRGYDRSQVDDHIARLHEEMRHLAAGLRQERDLALTRSHQLAAERDNALEHLYATQDELEALRNETAGGQGGGGAQAQPAQQGQSEIALFGDRLQTILATAEQEASAARAEAKEVAQRARQEAKQQADSIVADAKRRADEMLAQAREQVAALTDRANKEAEQITAKANQQAASTLEAATRDEREARANMAKLVTRREQVRAELTKIGQAIHNLLNEAQSVQRTDNGQPDTPAAKQDQPRSEKPGTPEDQEQHAESTAEAVTAQDQR